MPAKTALWLVATLAPLAVAALVIVRWDALHRDAEARADAERTAASLARSIDSTVGVAVNQLQSLAEASTIEEAVARNDAERLLREINLLRHDPAWLGVAVVGIGGAPLASFGDLPPASQAPAPPRDHVEFLRRDRSLPPRVHVSSPVILDGSESARVIGLYSLAELESATAIATDRSGLTLVTLPDGNVLLGPLEPSAQVAVLEPSDGGVQVRIGKREDAGSVVPAVGGAVRVISLRRGSAAGPPVRPALVGLALAGGLLIAYVAGWQVRLNRLYSDLAGRHRELTALREVATDATRSESSQQVIEMAGTRAAELVAGVQWSCVALVGPMPGLVQLHPTWPEPGLAPLALPLSDSPRLARVLRHGRREIGNASVEALRALGIRSATGGWECWSPLVAHGRILGALGLVCADRRQHLDDEQARLLDGLSATLAVALESHERMARLAEGRAMLAAVVEATPDGVLALDQELRVILDNPAARGLTALDRTMTGLPLREVIAQAEAEAVGFEWDFDLFSALERAQQGQTTRGSFRIRFDGTVRRMEALMAPLPLPEGARGALVAMRDVSEREELAVVRRLHERVSTLARQASSRAALLEQVFAASDAGMLFVSDRRVVWANRLFAELIGIEPVESGLDEVELERRIEVAAEGFPGLRPGAGLVHTRGPNRRILAARTVQVHDEDGQPIGCLVSLRDETAQRELDEAREQFIGVAAHELKNPLAVLRVQAELGLRNTERAGDALRRIRNRTQEMQELVERLLDATRAELGKLPLTVGEVELLPLAREAAEPFLGAGSPVTVSGDGSVRVRGDAVRIKQVLTNLISNGVRYGRGSTVEVEVSSREETARIAVSDKGPGIAPEERRRIFERFGQGRSGEKGPGLGIGLYLSLRLVEAHGGSIELVSTPGSGSTFTVVLPVRGPDHSVSGTQAST